MTDLIVFNVGSNRYALNIDNIQRIIQAKKLTDIPNANECIDGMMSHEESVIKVLNFRKLVGLAAHEEDSLDITEFSQKFIIFEKDNLRFAIKVDSIEDIAHVNESEIMKSDSEKDKNELLELYGVLDLNGVLINVIKTVSLPS